MKKPKQLIDLTGMEFLTELNKVLDAEVKKANAELADEGSVYHPEDLDEDGADDRIPFGEMLNPQMVTK